MATSFSFGQVIENLKDVGVFDYLLPFLLVFSIIFAILEKTKVLGSDKTNINAVVAAVAGLLVIVQTGIVGMINLFLPRVSLIVIVILMGLLLIALLAGDSFKGLQGGLLAFAVVIAIIAVILALTLPESGEYGLSLSPQDRDTLLNIGVPLGVFLLVIYLVTRPSKSSKDEGLFTKLLKGIEGGIKKD